MAGDNQLLIQNHDGTLVMSMYAWSERDEEALEALEGIVGFGFPGAEPRWFTGAGSGSLYRGGRTPARDLAVPFTAEAKNRAKLQDKMSMLARILDPGRKAQQARIRFKLADGELWYADVVRQSGGDWARGVDTDNRTWLNATIALRAGDPFFTRERPESFVVGEANNVNLLPYLAQMRLVSSTAFGTQEVENIGDAPSFPTWTLHGPFTSVSLFGPNGELLKWDGVVTVGHTIYIDTFNNTVTDETGANRYDGLADNPEFWEIDPGTSNVSVTMSSVDENSAVICEWRPRRWLVV